MQNFRCAFVFFLSLFVCSVVTQASAAAPPDPTEQLKPVVDKIVGLLKDPEFRKRPLVDQSEVVVDIVSERFDFREMSKRVMGKQ